MKAIFNIPYGLYVLTAKGEKFNGCIINTLQQITSNPLQVSITINKDNYTTKLIEKSGEFNVSILDRNTTFEMIKRFGFSSGRDVNKFLDFTDYKIAKNNIPYITKGVNSYLSAKVISKYDVGTHFTFVAEVSEDVVLNNNPTLTYAEYLNNVKPKPVTNIKTVYVCKICGYVYVGEELPKDFVCPICKHGAEAFEKQAKAEAVGNKQVEKEEITPKNKYYCPKCGNIESSDKEIEKCVICGESLIKI